MKRIKKAKIQFLSLCPRGKNRMPVLYKADGSVEFATVTKASEDAGELTNIVYPVDLPDADGHLASADVIKEMAYDAARNGLSLDIRHNGKALTKEQAYIAEQFLVQPGDPRFADFKDYDGKPVNTAGAWATVIKIDDPALRAEYRDGKWDGVSMAGTAELETVKEDTAAPDNDEPPSWFAKALRALGLGTRKEDAPAGDNDIDMKKEELVEVLKEQFSALVAALKPAAPVVETPVETPEVTKADEAVAPEGDSDEVKALRAQLAKALSRTPRGVGDEAPASLPDGLTKEDADAFERGRRMAEFINKSL